jgi:ribosomal protein S18 acetylase RimI-like enzyme
MPEPPGPHVEDLERAAARHWQAPDTEPLGEWQLRAAAGFTGRANSALPLGDPGCPLPEAVTTVEEWYRRRDLRPMIVLPQGAGPAHLEDHLTERGWLPRPGPAFVMIADTESLSASQGDVELAPEPDAAFLGLYRYRGQDLPPIARTLLMSAPWQAFGSIRRDRRAVAVGRVSVARQGNGTPLGVLTAVEVDRACRRQGLGTAITAGLAAAAATRGARRILLQVETGNDPARALYLRCGFGDSHRYHYMMAPKGDTPPSVLA